MLGVELVILLHLAPLSPGENVGGVKFLYAGYGLARCGGGDQDLVSETESGADVQKSRSCLWVVVNMSFFPIG